jgi:hypothetical protein
MPDIHSVDSVQNLPSVRDDGDYEVGFGSMHVGPAAKYST